MKNIYKPDRFFGLTQHKIRSFSAIVPGNTTREELEDGKFWVNVASQMEGGSEIRALADDNSFMCRLIVLLVNGTDLRVKCESFITFENVEVMDDEDYEVKNGGATGWYVKKKKTGERVKGLNNIQSQDLAYKLLAEYKQSMAA